MPATSVYEEALTGIATAIAALSLTGAPPVVNEDLPNLAQNGLPYISVCPSLQPEITPKGSNDRDNWVYGVQVSIIGGKDAVPRATVFAWRQAIRRRFSNQDLPAGTISLGTFVATTVTPLVPLDPVALQKQKAYVSVLLVKVEVKEGRV